MENAPAPTEQPGVAEPTKESSETNAEAVKSEQATISQGKQPDARESLLALIAKVDGLMPSPNQRAVKVWERLNAGGESELNVWDLLCFCSEAMGYLSVALIPEIIDNVKAISNQVHSTHYFKSADIFEWSQEPENKLSAINVQELVRKS